MLTALPAWGCHDLQSRWSHEVWGFREREFSGLNTSQAPGRLAEMWTPGPTPTVSELSGQGPGVYISNKFSSDK